MTRPLVLVCGTSIDASISIIKGIVKGTCHQSETKDEGSVVVPWTIDNKYYNAVVNLLSLADDQNIEHIDFNLVEAVIIYVHNFKGESLSTADHRRQLLSKSNCEVNILLCDKCDELFPREQAMVWCLDNDYQLIELREEPEPVDESCPIKDYYGVDRVIHTLHTHTWSNHEPKDECMMSSHFADLDNSDDEEDEGDLEYMDEFCKVFSQMSSVTENAASMPSEARKEYAEQVVKAFWKAIGGDESELDDTTAS